MQHQEFEPPEALRDTIKCFWYNRRDSELESGFEVVPDGSAEIIFHFGGNCSIANNGALQPMVLKYGSMLRLPSLIPLLFPVLAVRFQ